MPHRKSKNGNDNSFEEEPKPGIELNIQQLLFLQINRCNLKSSENTETFSASVSMFEIMLSPYLDRQYKDAIKSLDKSREECLAEKRRASSFGISRNVLLSISAWYSRMKYQYLIELAERHGLYPLKESNFET